MNTQEMVTIMQLEGGAKIVSAVYINEGYPPGSSTQSSIYHFKNVVGCELQTDDVIACETRDGYALLKVVDPDVMATECGCPLADLKHVMAKVRNDKFNDIKQAENNAHRQLALSEVTSKLSTYREQVGDGAFDSVAGLLGVDTSQRGLSDAVIDEEG